MRQAKALIKKATTALLVKPLQHKPMAAKTAVARDLVQIATPGLLEGFACNRKYHRAYGDLAGAEPPNRLQIVDLKM